jgi:hypothetical protein
LSPPRTLKSAAKKSLVVGADALRVAAAYRRLHPDGGAELPVVVCFDSEPDIRVLDRGEAEPWAGFEEILSRARALRARLAELTGAPASFSWTLRMDPQIADTWGSPAWAAEHYASELAELASQGDEFGLHTHTWRWDDGADTWVRDQDPAWEEHCVQVGLTTFEATFGRPCPTHRAGDRLLTGGMLRRLERGRVAVDLTVEPDIAPQEALIPGEVVTGTTTDFRGAPRVPYRSSPDACPAPDAASPSDPILVPLTTGPRGADGVAKELNLYMIPSLFAHHLLRVTRVHSPPVLAFAIRTDPGAIGAWDFIARNLEYLARLPGARFTTAGAAARRCAEPQPRSSRRTADSRTT